MPLPPTVVTGFLITTITDTTITATWTVTTPGPIYPAHVPPGGSPIYGPD